MPEKFSSTNASPAHVAGFFFCLAPAEGAGLLFCPAAIQPHTSVYSAFCSVNAVIPPTPQNSAQGFTVDFPAICRVLPLLFGWYIRLYRIACTTLEHITAPQHLQRIPDTTTAPGRCTGQRSRPIIIMYIRAAAYRRPCQPGGVSVSTCTGSAWRRLDASRTRRGSPTAGMRRAAAVIDGYRRIFFQAFAL